MRIIFFTDSRDFGSYAAAKGIRKLIAGESRFIARTLDCENFRHVKVNNDDLILVAGGGLLSPRLEPFWGWLASLRLTPVVLWGVGVSVPASRTTGVDPEIIKKLRPRILAANVRDDLTNEMYGLGAHVSFCPSAVWLSGLKPEKTAKKGTILFVDNPGLLARKDAELIGRLCGSSTDHSSPLGSLGVPGLLPLYRRASLVVTARVEGAIIASGLGLPYIACLPDMAMIEFHRMYAGGTLAKSPGSVQDLIKDHLESPQAPEPGRVDLEKISEFAEKFRKILYESLTPVDLGSCSVRR